MFLNRAKTFILLVGLSMILMLMGSFFGGQMGMQIALAFAIIMNIIAYFYSDKIVLRMYGAKPMDKDHYTWIYSILEELTGKMNIPMPKVWLIESSMANAFATGRNPSHASIAITSGIIDILDKDELRGVISHELAHIKNRDILIATIAATIATAISYMASMLRYAAFWGAMGGNRKRGNPFAMILISIITPIAAALVQLAISRSREYLADEIGAKYSQDPLALASALEKLHNSSKHTCQSLKGTGKESTASLFIVNPFSSKNLVALFSTHPPVTKRIERLRTMYENMFHI